MKRYHIKVNGVMFDVEVEEAAMDAAAEGTAETKDGAGNGKPAQEKKAPSSDKGDNSQIQRARAPKTPKKKTDAPAGGKAAAASVSADDALLSPMPGTILDICISPGDEVYAGETLIILEAMKMENEINSHKTGRIKEIFVKKGDSVNTGDILLAVE